MELLTKEIFNKEIREAKDICILGHVSPDGDCIGSTLAVYNYVSRVRDYMQITEEAEKPFRMQVYLEEINEKFNFLANSEKISSDAGDGKVYDLAIICDCADTKRLGKFEKYYKNANRALLIDHHFTNEGYGDYAIVEGDASSACEVLFGLLDMSMPVSLENGGTVQVDLFDKNIAECIYTGLAHDTGVFKYSSTSPYTMEIAGKCMSQGIDFGKIIEESFYSMDFAQKRVLGYVLSNIKMRSEGKFIYSWLDMDARKALDAVDMDMDGMIDQLRTTSGALAAAYMYETVDGRVKISLRSNSDLIDVSRVCQANGGGGHKKAAGCFMSKDFEKNMDEIEADFLEQLGWKKGQS